MIRHGEVETEVDGKTYRGSWSLDDRGNVIVGYNAYSKKAPVRGTPAPMVARIVLREMVMEDPERK